MATLIQEQLDISRLDEHAEEHTANPGFFLAGRALIGGTAVIRFPSGQSFNVVSHARRFADAVMAATGADSFGTYGGHSPTPERALDCFTGVPSDRRAPETPGLGRVLGDSIADFAIEHLDEFGVDYVIWRQHIYNPEIAEYWRQMEDRGGVTNNHFDHVHVSFNVSASGVPSKPTEQEIADMAEDWFRYAFEGQDYVVDRIRGTRGKTTHMDQLKVLDGLGCKELGKVSKFVDDYFRGVYGGDG